MDKETIPKPLRVESDNDEHVEEVKDEFKVFEGNVSSEMCSLENGNIKIHLGSNTLRCDVLCNLALDFHKKLNKSNGKPKPNYIR